MTIRQQVASEIDKLWRRLADLRDDPDISEELLGRLRRVSVKLAGCIDILESMEDGGPTAADIAGEVKHVQPPF